MAIAQLDSLVRIGKLKAEPPSKTEFEGLVRSGGARLRDATNKSLSPESRFDLAYNAAHALSLAALRLLAALLRVTQELERRVLVLAPIGR